MKSIYTSCEIEETINKIKKKKRLGCKNNENYFYEWTNRKTYRMRILQLIMGGICFFFWIYSFSQFAPILSHFTVYNF